MKKAFDRRHLPLAALVFSIATGNAQAQQTGIVRGTVSTAPASATPARGAGLPQDWSSRAFIYSGEAGDAVVSAPGRSSTWQVRYRDPRYVLAMARRAQAAQPSDLAKPASPLPTTMMGGGSTQSLRDSRRGHTKDEPVPQATDESSLIRDWSNVLGGGTGGLGGRGAQGIFPAKYNFDILATPSCANDFIVYPTTAAGVAQVAGTFETYAYAITGNPGANNTFTVGSGARQVVLTASTTSNTGANFLTTGTNTVRAQNLRDAINRWSSQTGFTATSGESSTFFGTFNIVTVRSVTAGNIANDAISETLDNVTSAISWYHGSADAEGTGTAGQATVVAFNQLYQGAGTSQPSGPCNGSWNVNGATRAPNAMWAYNTGAGYLVETSPVLSYHDDARQVAFIQRNGATLELVLLKWKAGEGTPAAPATPTTTSVATDYRNGTGACAGGVSCMMRFVLGGTSNVDSTATFSSPYVDFASDTLWVGDGNGRLHKFNNVFKGNPSQVSSGGFPATVAAGMKLSSPVYHAGNVYIGSQSGGAGIGGKIHRVDETTGAVVSSGKLANDNTTGFRDSPFVVVHGNTASIYAFVFNDGSVGDGSTCMPTADNDDACRMVVRLAPGFAEGASPLQKAYVGRGNSAVSTLYGGAFDDAFYASADGTGAMYIVGGAVADTFVPTLWKIPISAGAMGQPLAGPVVGSNDCNTVGDCLTNTWDWSPVTSIRNGANEYLYFSMGKKANLASTGCTGACLYMFNLGDLNGPSTAGTGAAWGTTNVAWAGLLVYGGTGGIVVDNISNTTGAAQVYFSHAATTGNAVQASQSALE